VTDTIKLQKRIKDSGITITHIAQTLGCTRNRVYSILKGSEATQTEIYTLSEMLHLTLRERETIFFKQ